MDPSLPHVEPERLVAFALGNMPPLERSTVKAHLARCPACRKRLAALPGDSLELLFGTLADAPVAGAAPPPSDQPTQYVKEGTPPVPSPDATTLQYALQDTPHAAPGVPEPAVPAVPSNADVAIQLPDFELQGVLGRGGMGIVYKARQISLNRPVAIKMLIPHQRDNPQSLARFQAEAQAAAGLNHPNIVAIHQVGHCTFGPFFVMEFIEGRTLQQVLDEQVPPQQFSIPWAVNLMAQVGDAVHFAHSRGIVHRDLKPDNIMIDKFKRPVVMDFGLVKMAGSAAYITGPGTAMGTPAYMPPEQAGQKDSTVGPFSDVYALGAILYRLLTGHLIFDVHNTLELLARILSDDVPPPARKVRPKIPLPLNLVVMKCLNKRPADRYPHAGAFVQALRQWQGMAGTAGTAGMAEAPTSTVRLRPAVSLVSLKSGKTIRLTAPTNIFGRGPDAHVILKALNVSDRHCCIHVKGHEILLEDLDSLSGTFVNGMQVKEQALQDGDRVDIGPHSFEVRLNRPVAANEPG